MDKPLAIYIDIKTVMKLFAKRKDKKDIIYNGRGANGGMGALHPAPNVYRISRKLAMMQRLQHQFIDMALFLPSLVIFAKFPPK